MSQRRAMGALFLLITAFFVGIAVAAASAAEEQAALWVIVVAAAALAAWMGGLAFRALARSRS